jgi:hypothetical protein
MEYYVQEKAKTQQKERQLHIINNAYRATGIA